MTSDMEHRLRLQEPHAGLADSYRHQVREFVERGEPLVPFPLSFEQSDFPALLGRLAACARGEGIPEGWSADLSQTPWRTETQ